MIIIDQSNLIINCVKILLTTQYDIEQYKSLCTIM